MDDQDAPRNEDPEFIRTTVSTVSGVVQTYGWLILITALVLFYLWSKIQPHVDKLKQQKEENDYKKMDTGLTHSRLEAMEKARQKMQEELDCQAMEYMEKQKLREEEKRKQKIEDWQRHQEGKGYRSKTKIPEDKPQPSTCADRKKPKKALKPDYNPLMGDMGSASYRPTRRGGASGGG